MDEKRQGTWAIVLSAGSVIAAAIVGTLIVEARENNSRTPSADQSTCESGLQLARADASSAMSDSDTAQQVFALYQGSEDVSIDIRDALRDWSDGYTQEDPSLVSRAATDFIDECHVAGVGP